MSKVKLSFTVEGELPDADSVAAMVHEALLEFITLNATGSEMQYTALNGFTITVKNIGAH